MGLFSKKPLRIEAAPRVTTDRDDWDMSPLICGNMIYNWCWWDGIIERYTANPARNSGQLTFQGGGADIGARFVFSGSPFLNNVALSTDEMTEDHGFVVGNSACVLGLGDSSQRTVLYFPTLIIDMQARGGVQTNEWLDHICEVAGAVNKRAKPYQYNAGNVGVYWGGMQKEELKRCFLNYFCAVQEIFRRVMGLKGQELVEMSTRVGNEYMHEFWDG